MPSCGSDVYVVTINRLTNLKQRLMDPSEGRPCVEPSDTEELPPLYDAVNSKDSEDRKSPCSNINLHLLPFKAFFYFFYGAIGALFPFLALYYRHLWLSPTQAGLLIGLRPIVQSIFGPPWAFFADRFNAKKIVLFIGLCGWLFTHCTILLVPSGEKPLSCNEISTNVVKRSAKLSYDLPYNIEEFQDPPHHNLPSNTHLEESEPRLSREPSEIERNEQHISSFNHNAKQPKSSNIENFDVDSRNNDVDSWWTMSSNQTPLKTWHTFIYLCLIIFIGNIFAAPAQTMANTATLQALGSETHKYGMQRCFGSIGWGVAAFVVGMLVSMNHDSSLACKGLDDINYSPCFYAFGVMMLLSLVAAIFFKYQNAESGHSQETHQPCLQTLRQLDCLTLFVFFTAFFAGFNMGFIQTFLFWHLQTIGGTQRLFSLITGFNAVGEMIGFVLSVKLISKYGHLKVLALGIFAYAIRLTVYGVVENPWIVLTVEFLKCFTSSAVWASVMSYIAAASQCGATLPAIVHMLYWGVGYGGGGILGGVLMETIGARSTFLSLAVLSLILVIAILLIVHLNCCQKRKQDIYMPVDSEDDEDEEQESE